MPRIEEQTAFTLRSSAELNYQIRDQLETASNRSDHLTEEMKSMRQKIALSDRRREKSLGKAKQIRRDYLNNAMPAVRMMIPHAVRTVPGKNCT